MRRLFLFIAFSLSLPLFATTKYNGKTITACSDYVRSEAGTISSSTFKEVSGLACSRTTPGYLWIEGDEKNDRILAIDEAGNKVMTLKLSNVSREDWEDICTGTYNNTKYIFVGAFGDNDLQYANQYYILCIPEPAITKTTTTISNYTLIRFGFPYNAAHNVETLMYDPIEQMFYIADKIKGSPDTLYSLPMSLNYGSTVQQLTYVCTLGAASDGFNFLTAGDISPDGSLVAIKSKTEILLWTRQGSESLTTTFTRPPQYISTYQEETQGEAFAWKDNYTFFTTSDDKNDVPLYRYTKPKPTTSIATPSAPDMGTKFLRNGRILIRRGAETYNLLGQHL